MILAALLSATLIGGGPHPSQDLQGNQSWGTDHDNLKNTSEY